jgi:NADH-quinone oxidoreductase subunit H
MVYFFISSLAETSRAPFDLPEAESELVSGYNVEYSAVGFAFFFIAEYANIILMSIVNVILFFGGWFDFATLIPESSILNTKFVFLNIYFFKILFFLFLFIWVRSALPRYRYDQLMDLGWKIFLPISLGIYMFCSLTFFVLNNYFF